MMDSLPVNLDVKKRWQRLSRKLLQLAMTAVLHLRQASRLGLIPDAIYQNYLDSKDVQQKPPKQPAES